MIHLGIDHHKKYSHVVALEIDTVDRFASPANSTYSSGGKTSHGGLIPACNHHLRYAFIEAAWIAIRVSPYFDAFFKRLKYRKGSQDAAGAVGRKLCEIAYYCLKQRRDYREKPYQFRSGRLVRELAGR